MCSAGKAARHAATVEPAAGWRSTDPISPGSMSWQNACMYKNYWMPCSHRPGGGKCAAACPHLQALQVQAAVLQLGQQLGRQHVLKLAQRVLVLPQAPLKRLHMPRAAFSMGLPDRAVSTCTAADSAAPCRA